jgi:diacylglycerol kinase family enzyme
MKAAVILNKHSGTSGSESADSLANKITDELKKSAIEPVILPIGKENFKSTIDTVYENDFEAIIAGGGDGTINSAAEISIKKDIPLGVIPLGTYNHFSKDLKIPLDLTEALKVIGKKEVRRIDIGKINNNYFLNNSSVGLYPRVVEKREEEIEESGAKKFWAMCKAALIIFVRYPVMDINIKAEGKEMRCKTTFVFVGNNFYRMDLLNLGARECFDTGKLSIYFPNTSGKLSLFKFILLALFNRLNQEKDFSIMETDDLILDSRKKRLKVSLDGEVIEMAPPLKYEIIPQGLKVFANVQNRES